MQIMRREWINEGKPQYTSEDGLKKIEGLELVTQGSKSRKPQESLSDIQQRSTTPFANDIDDHDLYSATPRNLTHRTDLVSKNRLKESLFLSDNEAASQPSEDDLDALLAEDNQNLISGDLADGSHPAPQGRNRRLEVDFEDEMEAMADMDDMW